MPAMKIALAGALSLALPAPRTAAPLSPAALAAAPALSVSAARAAPAASRALMPAAAEAGRELSAALASDDVSAAAATLERVFDGAEKAGAPVAAEEYALQRRVFADSYRWNGEPAVKVAFFDADSTLRVSRSGSVSANGPKDVMLLPWIGPKLAELARDGWLIVIVSNQAGVGKHVTLEDSDRALAYTVDLIRGKGGEVHYFDFAENDDGDRKPGTGMAERLETLLRARHGSGVFIDKARSFMVGDSAYKKAKKGKPADKRPDGGDGTHFSNSDRLFAENYGIAFHEPAEFFGWRRYGVDVFTKRRQVQKFLRKHGAAEPD